MPKFLPALAARLRIGLIAPPWLPVPPPAYGGTESVVDLLARGLAAAGHDVRLVCRADSTCPVDRRSPEPPGPHVPLGDTLEELRYTAAAYEQLGDVDVIHDHTLLGPLIGPSAGSTAPLAVTHHGPFDAATRPLFKAIAGHAAVVAISRSQARAAHDVPVHRVIHHGLDIDRFPVGTGGGGYVLHLCRMAPEKGADLAVRAARAAEVPIRIAAKMHEPHERAFFEDKVRPLLGSDAEYVGEVTQEEKTALLGDAIALVNPIRWDEPFGLVMIEALATGTPVVAFPNGAAPEIVTQGVTGFLCRGWGELVDGILQAPSLDRAACRASAIERFSAERMVADHVDLYRSLVSAHRRGGSRRLPAQVGE